MIAGSIFIGRIAPSQGFACKKKNAASQTGAMLFLLEGSGENSCFAALARCARLYRTPLGLRLAHLAKGDASPPVGFPRPGRAAPGPCPPSRGVDARMVPWAGDAAPWMAPSPWRPAGLGYRPRRAALGGGFGPGRERPDGSHLGRCSRLGPDALRAALLDAGSHQSGIAARPAVAPGLTRWAHAIVCRGWTPCPRRTHNYNPELFRRRGGRTS